MTNRDKNKIICEYIISKSGEINYYKLSHLLCQINKESLKEKGYEIFEDNWKEWTYRKVYETPKYLYSKYSSMKLHAKRPEIENVLREEEIELIDSVIEKYRDYSEWDMVKVYLIEN